MKILVAGGTGMIGSEIVRALELRGCEPTVACRHFGTDASTGEGLQPLLEDVSVVIDAMDAASTDAETAASFFRAATRNLLAAGLAGSVRHHVMLSVLGVDGLSSSGYIRAKMDQERLVAGSGLPYSIVRSAQVLEGVRRVVDAASCMGTVRIPPIHLQPVALRDLASVVADISIGPPAAGVVEVAGPDALPFETVVRDLLAAWGDARTVVVSPEATYLGAQPGERSLLPRPSATVGSTHFLEWVRDTSGVDASTQARIRSNGTTAGLFRDRIDPRYLPPEAVLDALIEWRQVDPHAGGGA